MTRVPFGWIVVWCVWASVAAAQIGVSPPRSEVFLDEGAATHTLRVYNFGDNDIDVAVSVKTWELDENSKVQLVEPTEQSLDQWMIVNPLKFHLTAGGSQAIRFSVRPKVAPEPGEHRAIIYFDELPGENEDPTVPKVRFRFGSAVYAYANPIERSAVLQGLTFENSILRIDVESTGNAHVRLVGQMAIWRADAYPGPGATTKIPGLDEGKATLPEGVVRASMLPSTPVLAGTRRTLAIAAPPDLDPGDYVFDVDGTIENISLQQGFEFTIALPAVTQPAVTQPTATPEPASAAEPTSSPPPGE
jgi:P pilus assembly chaperone PapD